MDIYFNEFYIYERQTLLEYYNFILLERENLMESCRDFLNHAIVFISKNY